MTLERYQPDEILACEAEVLETARKPVGEVLKALVAEPGSYWTVGELSAALSDRGFGVVLFAFALPNMIPFPIPGTSIVTCMPLLFIALQIVIGRKSLWLPLWLSKKHISRSSFKKMVEWLMPYLIKAERITRPRNYVLVSPFFERLAGGIATFLGVLIALPIPLGNFMPGVAIGCIALAIAQQDGRLMVAGWLASIAATLFVLLLATGCAQLFLQILANIM